MQYLKKIGTTLMGSVLTGATLLGGALAADISDFTSGKLGPSDTVVVVGASAATADVVGAINIGAALYGHGVTATAAGGTTTTTVEGGVSLATSTKALFIGDQIKDAGKTTLTKVDLPTTLASKTFADALGTSYKYDQYLDLSKSTSMLTYGKPSGQNEPFGYINMTSGSAVTVDTAYAYQARVTFNDPINLSSTNVQGQTLTLFGVDYTIGSTSTSIAANQKLVLFGSGNTALIAEGDKATVKVGSTDHTVSIDIVSDATNAYVSVDGGSSTKVTNKALYTINGVDVYVNDIIYVSKTGGISKVKVSLGSGRITLESGQAVKIGTSDTAVDGTKVTITGTNQMSTLKVAVGAKDSSSAFIKEGADFSDPVFGTFKLSFSGYAPSLTDATRDAISVTTSGNDRATVKFKDYNGNEKSLDYARDSATSTTGTNLLFQDGNQYNYHVVEGEAAASNDYIIADANDASHLFQVGSISSFGSSGGKVTLKDVFTGTNYDFNLDSPSYLNGTKSIDGQNYYINVTSSTGPVKLTWVAGTDLQRADVTDNNVAVANAGDYATVFPAIKAKNGEKVYLTAENQTLTLTANGTTKFILPTGILEIVAANNAHNSQNITYRVGTTSAPTGDFSGIAAAGSAITIGKQKYWLVNNTISSSAGAVNLSIADSTGTKIRQPAVLIKEKKNDNSEYETVIVKTGDDSNGIAVDTGVDFSGFSVSGTSTTTSSLTKYLDLWGTALDLDTSSQGTVKVTVPDTQVSGSVYVLTAAATAPTTTTTTGTATVNLPSLGSGISKLDKDTLADKTTKNLILVGGPAVNTLVAELGTAGKTPTLTEWRTKLQGKGVIQAVGDAFATGKTAIVVAGYEADQTNAASLKLATADKTFKGAAQQVIGGVWSAFTYPLVAATTTTTTTNTTTNTTA